MMREDRIKLRNNGRTHPARRRNESFASLFKGCGFSGQSPEPHPAGCGIPFLIFAFAKINEKEQKKRDPQVAQFSGKTNHPVGLSRELRHLRMALFLFF